MPWHRAAASLASVASCFLTMHLCLALETASAALATALPLTLYSH